MKRLVSTDFVHFLLSSLLLLMVPLITINSGISPYETPKYIFIISVSIAAAIYTVIYVVKNVVHTSPFIYLVYIYLLIQWFTSLLGIDRYTSFFGSESRHQGMILLVCCILIFRFSSLIKNYYVEKVLVASNGLVILYAFAQLIGVFMLHIASIPTYQNRIIGTLGSPGFLGGFIVMTLPFIINFHVSKKNLFYKYLVIALNILVLFFTFSYSSYIAAFFILGITVAYHHSFRLYGWIYLKYILGIFSGVALLFLYFSQNLHYSPWDNRLLIWSNAWSAIQKSPIIGYGAQNFDLLFPKERLMLVDDPHNIFLNILLSSGIVGLLCFGALIVFIFNRSTLVFKMSILGFLIYAFFNPLSVVHIIFFWYLTGVIEGQHSQNDFISSDRRRRERWYLPK